MGSNLIEPAGSASNLKRSSFASQEVSFTFLKATSVVNPSSGTSRSGRTKKLGNQKLEIVVLETKSQLLEHLSNFKFLG